MDSTVSSKSSEPPGSRARRSCRRCCERKVKCDRNTPCSNCIGVDLASACSYPPGLGRARKIPKKKMANDRLGERLRRLEDILSRVQDARTAASDTAQVTTKTLDHDSATSGTGHADLARLPRDERGSYDVSNSLWASLSNEVVELRELLDSWGSSDEERDLRSTGNRRPEGANAIIFGLRSASSPPDAFRPQMSQFGILFAAFIESVAPVHHVFHLPTLTPQFWAAAVSTGSHSPQDFDNEALLFAICYATAASLTDEACIASLRVSKGTMLEQLRYGTEQAMARADLLNTQSMTILQALTLYIYALRIQDDSRAAASLTALLVHLARSIGLHRDGSNCELSPFDTELRRRLWANVCLLDARQAEYYGRASNLQDGRGSFDTRLPLHINDADLDKNMTSAPKERNGLCDMTLCLIRCNALRALWRISHPSVSLEQRKRILASLEQDLETRYLSHCDTSQPLQLYISLITKIIVAKSKLALLHYEDLHAREHGSTSQTQLQAMRDMRFTQAIEVLHLSVQIHTREDLARWRLHARGYIQWYTGAFVLSELCSRPASSECDRAWEYISVIFERCPDKERRGSLFRSLKRLMSRAHHVREQQKNMAGVETPVQDIPDSLWSDMEWTSLQAGWNLGFPTPDLTADWLDIQDQSLFDFNDSTG